MSGSSQRFESVYSAHLGIKVQGLREGFLGIRRIYRDLLSAARSLRQVSDTLIHRLA